MTWMQGYDPLGWSIGSSLVAASPIVVLSGMLLLGFKAPKAALAGLVLAFIIAVGVFKMPIAMALTTTAYGACYGLLPIGWLVFSALFLFNLTVRSGQFEIVKHSVAAISPDRRMQALLIAFCFGSFLEGCAGFGAPVAISAALLIGLGFPPLSAAVLCLLANTAPVAFGSLGIPVVTLAKVAGLDLTALTQMVGRQLPFFSLIIPTWLVVVMSGWRGVKGCWPALLVCGGVYAVIQYVTSNFQGPALVDVLSGIGTLLTLAIFLRFWQPRDTWRFAHEDQTVGSAAADGRPDASASLGVVAPAPDAQHISRAHIAYAWTPWLLLSLMISLWGSTTWKHTLDRGVVSAAHALGGAETTNIEVPGLHNRVLRTRPAVPTQARAEPALYDCDVLTPAGTGVWMAAILSAFWLRISPRAFFQELGQTLFGIRWALFTIACMLALAFTIKYSGEDVTMGLLFVRTGRLYPLFAPFLGWLGVVVTGSDTSANAMFGSLQRITAERLGLSPILIAASNTCGGVMGKMIAAQSIVIAAAATKQTGQESRIFRITLLHSLALVTLVGVLTLLQAYLLRWMIP
jgi:lactate permease